MACTGVTDPLAGIYPATRASILALVTALTERIMHTAAAYAFHRRGEGSATPYDIGAAGRFHMVHPRGCAEEITAVQDCIAENDVITAELCATNGIAKRAVLRYFEECNAIVQQNYNALPATNILEMATCDFNQATSAAIKEAVSRASNEMSGELLTALLAYDDGCDSTDDGEDEIRPGALSTEGPVYDSTTEEDDSDGDDEIDARIAELDLSDDEVAALMENVMTGRVQSSLKQSLQSHYASLFSGISCSDKCECALIDEAADMPWHTTEADGLLHAIRRMFEVMSTRLARAEAS